jgi:hypothetical protein
MGTVLVVTGAILATLGRRPPHNSLAIFLISGMLAVLFAKRPIALRQGLRTRADIVEYVQEHEGRVR